MKPYSSLTVLLASVLLSACGDSSAGTTSGSSSQARSAAPSASVAAAPSVTAAPPKPVFKADPEVVKLVKAIAAGCAVGDDGWVRDCKAGEEEALFAYVRKNKPEAYFGTLADVALGEGKSDKKLFGAATHEIGFLPNDVGDAWYAANGSAAAVDLLLKAAEAVDQNRMSRVAPGIAAVVLAGGKRAEFMKFLDARPEKDELRRSAVLYWVKYGGVDALADLEHFTTAKDDTVRYDAGWAPGVAIPGPFGGTPLSDAAKQTVCDAGKKLLASADDKVFHGAAESMSRCKGAYIDATLDAIEKRASAAPPPKGDAQSLHHTCWGEGVVGATPNGSKDQCGRALGLLETIAKKDGTDSEDVFMAVFAAKYFARDVPDLKARAEALRDSFKGSKDKRVADEAKQPIK